MNIFFKAYCRIFQAVFRICVPLLPWSKPQILQGEGANADLAQIFKSKKIESVLLVTDSGISKLGLTNALLETLKQAHIAVFVYDKTNTNPTIDNVEEAVLLYRANKCNAIIGFGGGSAMDCAKGIAARIARKRTKIPQLRGVLRVLVKTPLVVAVPTTSGTGSEATCAAIITDSKTHDKFAINDLVLIPKIAILNPHLTVGLPPSITAQTGIDALVHAIEAYIGQSGTKETDKYAVDAATLVFTNLEKAYKNGSNLEARKNMQIAAYYAGIAFTRAYVGYIHSIAHTFGGFYGVPHGLANAVIMPYVLDYYGESAHKKLAELSEIAFSCGFITDTDFSAKTNAQKSALFIQALGGLNERLGIPKKIDVQVGTNEAVIMAQRAFNEANPLYPVPKLLGKNELIHLIKEVSV